MLGHGLSLAPLYLAMSHEFSTINEELEKVSLFIVSERVVHLLL